MGIKDLIFNREKKAAPRRVKEIDGVEFEYLKLKKSKSIKITVKNRYKVKVTMPCGCTFEAAENFVFENENWIKDKLEEESTAIIKEDFKTRTGNLIISSGLTKTPVIRKTGDIIQFIYPIGADFYSKEMQQFARLAVKKALYLEAKEYLPKRTKELAEEFGFKFNKLALKTGKTRWGSCSFRNNINLNINLLNLEDEFIDYVIIHELCHTVEKNHQKGFWELVYRCMPKAPAIRKKLKTKKLIV